MLEHVFRGIWCHVQTCWDTPGALKRKPPIYFKGNYNRYRDHNNNIGESKFSATKHYFPNSCHVSLVMYFLPALNESPYKKKCFIIMLYHIKSSVSAIAMEVQPFCQQLRIFSLWNSSLAKWYPTWKWKYHWIPPFRKFTHWH